MDSLHKPAYAGQYWLSWSPTTGGIVCGKSDKSMVEHIPLPIVQIQETLSTNKHVCNGKFSHTQLAIGELPGVVATSSWRPASIVALLLLCLLQTLADVGQAQAGMTTEVINKPVKQSAATNKKVDSNSYSVLSGIIRAKYGVDTIKPLPFATVSIPRLGIATVADADGHYILKVPIADRQGESVKLLVECKGFPDYEQHVSPLTEGLIVMDIEAYETILSITIACPFYGPTRWQSFKRKIGNLFR